MSKGLKSFLAGILITVIGGLIIWYLTLQGSILNPDKSSPPKVPHATIKIKDINVSSPEVGYTAWSNFTVVNESGTIGEKVEIKWYSGTEVGKQIRKDPTSTGSEYISKEFYLGPNESRPIRMQSLKYNEVGKFPSKILVEIEIPNSSILADEHMQQVVVLPLSPP